MNSKTLEEIMPKDISKATKSQKDSVRQWCRRRGIEIPDWAKPYSGESLANENNKVGRFAISSFQFKTMYNVFNLLEAGDISGVVDEFNSGVAMLEENRDAVDADKLERFDEFLNYLKGINSADALDDVNARVDEMRKFLLGFPEETVKVEKPKKVVDINERRRYSAEYKRRKTAIANKAYMESLKTLGKIR